MVTTYTVLKTIHVLATVAWLGGGAILVMLLARARRADDTGTLIPLVKQVGFVGPRVFGPASLILVITGIWMIQNAGLTWDLWIILGLVGWAGTFVTGNFFLRPAGDRLEVALEEKGAEDPVTLTAIDRILTVGRVDQLVLALVVIDMVIKPT